MSILTLGSKKEGNEISNQRERKNRGKEIPNQRVGERKKKRKKIHNQNTNKKIKFAQQKRKKNYLPIVYKISLIPSSSNHKADFISYNVIMHKH